MSMKYDALSIPPAAQEEGGVEVLRAAVSGDKLSVSLRSAFADPQLWGSLLASVARQVADIYGQTTGVSALEVRERIRVRFAEEMAAPEEPGTTVGVR
jgi:Domain of unknown function (DUF5076)